MKWRVASKEVLPGSSWVRCLQVDWCGDIIRAYINNGHHSMNRPLKLIGYHIRIICLCRGLVNLSAVDKGVLVSRPDLHKLLDVRLLGVVLVGWCGVGIVNPTPCGRRSGFFSCVTFEKVTASRGAIGCGGMSELPCSHFHAFKIPDKEPWEIIIWERFRLRAISLRPWLSKKKALIIGCNHTKTLQHLIENHVVTINRPISSTFYNRIRIPIVLSISVHQPFEFLNF